MTRGSDPHALPQPVDPTAVNGWARRIPALVLKVGVVMYGLALLDLRAQQHHPGDGFGPFGYEALFVGGLVALAGSATVRLVIAGVEHRRRRARDRRLGFQPRPGRHELPPSGRTTLVRCEIGSRDVRLCLMVARWDYHREEGWQRGRVIEHAWVSADDPVAIGEQRAYLAEVANDLEERLDDARLRALGDRRLSVERAEADCADEVATRQLAESLVRERP